MFSKIIITKNYRYLYLRALNSQFELSCEKNSNFYSKARFTVTHKVATVRCNESE